MFYRESYGLLTLFCNIDRSRLLVHVRLRLERDYLVGIY
jgi:hypothetical protein